jgi:hypothetical protein
MTTREEDIDVEEGYDSDVDFGNTTDYGPDLEAPKDTLYDKVTKHKYKLYIFKGETVAFDDYYVDPSKEIAFDIVEKMAIVLEPKLNLSKDGQRQYPTTTPQRKSQLIRVGSQVYYENILGLQPRKLTCCFCDKILLPADVYSPAPRDKRRAARCCHKCKYGYTRSISPPAKPFDIIDYIIEITDE